MTTFDHVDGVADHIEPGSDFEAEFPDRGRVFLASGLLVAPWMTLVSGSTMAGMVFADPLTDLRIQWKACGTLVGSFNLFVYGALYYVGERLSGDERAARSRLSYALFGVGLIASGLHTMSATLRLWLDLGIFRACSLGSPGLGETKFPRPVRPGDTIKVITDIVELRASASRPDRGLCRVRQVTVNQRSEPVMEQETTIFLKRRPVA